MKKLFLLLALFGCAAESPDCAVTDKDGQVVFSETCTSEEIMEYLDEAGIIKEESDERAAP